MGGWCVRSPPLLHQQCPSHSHQSYDTAVYEDAAASSWTAIACPGDNERVNAVVSGGGLRGVMHRLRQFGDLLSHACTIRWGCSSCLQNNGVAVALMVMLDRTAPHPFRGVVAVSHLVMCHRSRHTTVLRSMKMRLHLHGPQ